MAVSFDSIASIWNDLEMAYKKSGSTSRTDYLTRLLGFKLDGDCDGRKLVGMVAACADREGKSEAEVEALCAKITTAVSNLKSQVNRCAGDIDDLNVFCEKKVARAKSFYDMQLTGMSEVVPIEELLNYGSILPVTAADGKAKFRSMVSSDGLVLYNESELAGVFAGGFSKPIIRALATFIKSGSIQYPLFITKPNTERAIRERFGDGSLQAKIDYEGQENIATLRVIPDQYNEVAVVMVNEEARWP